MSRCFVAAGLIVLGVVVERNVDAGENPFINKYGELPLSFQAGRSHTSSYIARGQGYLISVGSSDLTIGVQPSQALPLSTIRLQFLGARQTTAVPEAPLPGKVNYIIGSDPKKWDLGLPTFERVRYRDLYPGVDVVYYGNQQHLEFDLDVRPGARPDAIRLKFEGVSKVAVDETGSIVLGSRVGELTLKAPVVYQEIAGRRQKVNAKYRRVSNGEIGFELGAFDHTQSLVIDPTIVYSTFVGGGSSYSYPQAIAVDSSNNAYIAGYTYAADFPTVSPAIAGYHGNSDGFITKLNSTGTALVYSTYIGGTGYDEFYGIAVDGSGTAWVTGQSNSTDFPTMSPSQGNSGGNFDAVVVKLNASGALLFSSYLGGPNTDSGRAVALDPSGNAYVTGYALSGFPTTQGVVAAVNQGSFDGFVAKYSPTGSLLYSTFLGGSFTDYAYGIAVDSGGNAYVTGTTNSSQGFKNAPSGGAQATYAGGGDAFVAKLNPAATALVYFTFLGGSLYEVGHQIVVDSGGNAYVAGETSSADFPASGSAYQTTLNGATNGFVAKLNSAGSAFSYKTYIGGNRADSLNGLALEASSGSVYLAGATDSSSFPNVSALQTALPGTSTAALFQTNNSGGSWNAFDFGSGLRGTVNAVSPDPTPGSAVVSTDVGIFKTTNSGASWTLQSSISSVGLSRSPAISNVIYAVNGTSNSTLAYKSVDGGNTWSQTGSIAQCCAYDVVADPNTTNTVYAFYQNYPLGVAKSIDGGVTWSAVNTGLASLTVQSMVAGSDGSLYVALQTGGVYKSTNQGGSWTSSSSGLPASFFPNTIAISANSATTLYVADSSNVYKSTNGGGSWAATTAVPNGSVATVGVSPQNAQNVYAASFLNPVVYQSTDGGASWNASATGLGNATPFQLVFSLAGSSQVYALTSVTSTSWVAKMNAAGTGVTYATFLGGSGGGYLGAVATNGTGDAFVAGYTYSSDFPVSSGAYSTTYLGNAQAFVTRISDATAACTYSINPGNQLIYGLQQDIAFTVVAPSGCTWTATSNQSFATVNAGANGTGTGEVSIQVSANTGSASRSATLTIAGQTVTLNQASNTCSYVLNYNATVPVNGGAVPVQLTTGATCDWNVLNDAPSAVTVSGASSPGPGTINLNVAANPGPGTRSLRLYIADVYVSLNQAGTQGGCTFTVTPPGTAPVSGGLVTIPVATTPGCSWTSSSNVPWATISGSPGTTGSGSVTFSLTANPTGPGLRSGTLTVAGQTITLTQASPVVGAPQTVTYDINIDGKQDVAVYYSGSVGYQYSLLSNGNGTYTGTSTPGINPGGGTFDTVLQADFNGDSKSDILFYSTGTGAFKVGIGDGTGAFVYAPTLAISTGYNVIARGDFNGDGKTDLLFYRQTDGTAYVALSKGDGTFNFIAQNFSPGFTTVAVADYNGDGISDVILYNNQTPPYVAYYLPGDGTGHFVGGTGLFFGGGYSLYPVDLNADGKSDFILYRPTDGTVYVAINNGTSFTYHYMLFSSFFTSFKIGDVNGDGFPDLVLYNNVNAIGYLLLGNGTGNFTSVFSLFFGPGFDHVELRDLNGDGKEDVIIYRTSDGTNYTGISNGSGFNYTYNYFGPGRFVAR